MGRWNRGIARRLHFLLAINTVSACKTALRHANRRVRDGQGAVSGPRARGAFGQGTDGDGACGGNEADSRVMQWRGGVGMGARDAGVAEPTGRRQRRQDREETAGGTGAGVKPGRDRCERAAACRSAPALLPPFPPGPPVGEAMPAPARVFLPAWWPAGRRAARRCGHRPAAGRRVRSGDRSRPGRRISRQRYSGHRRRTEDRFRVGFDF